MSSNWPVWCELVCKKCRSTTAGQFNVATLNKVTLRNEALRKGWRIVANEWLCIDCLDGEIDRVHNQGQFTGRSEDANS